MPGAPLVVFLASSALALFAFMIFQGGGGTTSGAQHWATAPLTAATILISSGGLVALASGRGR